MTQPNESLHLLALLVHRGYLGREGAQRVAQAMERGLGLADAMANETPFSPEYCAWLVETKAGQYPRIPGFEVGPCLGRGGTSEVFRVKELKTGQTMVLKVLGPVAMRQKATLKGFVEEGKRLALLRHPGLVEGYGVARYGEVIFSKLEYVEGETLQDILDRQGVFQEDEALALLVQVAQALQYLAQADLVHRDVKPGNIMVTEEGRVKLIDLGFCAVQDEACREGLAVGTVEYLSPEQALGGAGADVRSDIYSLGVTLFQMTIGRLPF
ncbi:MAG TPA: serine/threonine-protein kinase, partial [Planctomycetota bacterium]|nr:serine/threonine-protein kinase [Planctomycetota bacterium]